MNIEPSQRKISLWLEELAFLEGIAASKEIIFQNMQDLIQYLKLKQVFSDE